MHIARTLILRTAATVGALLTLAAVGSPAAAFADAPPVSTVKSVSIIVPALPAGTDHAEVRVDLATVPVVPAIGIRMDCDGYGPALFQSAPSSPAAPGVVSYVFRTWPALSGVRCTVSGYSTIPSQTVEFSATPAPSNDHGVLVTTIAGLVISHSPSGGLD